MRWSPSPVPIPPGIPIPVRNRLGQMAVLPTPFPAYHQLFADRAGQLWIQNAVGTQVRLSKPYRLLDALSADSVPLESK